MSGADSASAREARAQLEKVPHKGMFGALARAAYDGSHGRTRNAVESYVDAIAAARGSTDPRAPMVAWYSSNNLMGLASNAAGFWPSVRARVEDLIKNPGAIGWRARAELVEWWADEARRSGVQNVADRAAELHGCVREARIAGPFGHGVAGDTRRVFDAERPGTWPSEWAPDPGIHRKPHVLKTERTGCYVRSSEPTTPGVFYTETFLELPADQEIVLAVRGAFRVLVDDQVVLDRDTRVWGVWTRFGVSVRLDRGRHRIVARSGTPDTSIRVLAPDGAPLKIASSSDPAPGYVGRPPLRIADANLLDSFVREGKVVGSPGEVTRWLAAYLAHVEGQADVASVMMEPLVKDPARASGLMLGLAAMMTEKDPIYPDSDRHDLARELRAKAVAKDAGLWWARFWLAVDQAEKKGLPEVVDEVRKLADEFPEVPEILEGLLDAYERLGWKAERSLVAQEIARRFPENLRVLRRVVNVLDEQGEYAAANAIAGRIEKQDPDSGIAIERALMRHDFAKAIEHLQALTKRRPDRKELVDQMTELLTRAGERPDAVGLVGKIVARKPQDADARMRLADARYAAGNRGALRRELSDGILAGAGTAELLSALELVEGVTELEPYRLDGAKVVREYEASRKEMDGTAARVLDYSAIWVHPDGSSRMLEHELIRIQSQEAIGKMAEQRIPEGLVLKMRVLKKNGAVLEPEFVSGKPTVTMPHVEVGDYIETESITSQNGDGQFGKRYLGPHWFFREADVAYWRSEIVIVTPKDKPIVIEQHGQVPPPTIEDRGPLVARRWRVDRSPAAPTEPGSPPIREYLPSVRVGWGITLADHARRLADMATDELPRDPRLVRMATQIAPEGLSVNERARRLYRWVITNVEEGREADGRRVVIGKAGNRTSGFLYLCRTLGIPAEVAVVRDRLAPPPLGPIDETEAFDDVVVRLGTDPPLWLTVRDKFAPFGYLPGPLRGQPAFRLVPGTPRETTGTQGGQDGVTYEATGELRADGSATMDLAQRFLGKPAIELRSGLEQFPATRLKEVVEGRLLARAVPGARLGSLSVEHQSDLDEPIVMHMRIEVRDFARTQPQSRELLLSPPFAIRISQLTSLPSRQTPLILPDPTYAAVKISLKLPPGAMVVGTTRAEVRDGDRRVAVLDRQEGGTLILERIIDIPAGRVQPGAYADLQKFARDADDATMRDVRIRLPAQ